MDMSPLSSLPLHKLSDEQALAKASTPLLHTSGKAVVSDHQSAIEGVSVSLQNMRVTTQPLVFEKYSQVIQTEISNLHNTTQTTINLARQLTDPVYENRFDGAGTRFSELIASGESSYQQQLRQYSFFSPKSLAGNKIDFSRFEVASQEKVQELSLSLTTRSGARISFQLESFNGKGKTPDETITVTKQAALLKEGKPAYFATTEISFEVKGDLTKKEQQQLEEFGKNLEAFASDLLTSGTPNLKQLGLASFDSIDSLSLQSSGGGATPLSLEYRNNDEQRRISLKFAGNTAEITVDKNDQLTFSQSGKQKALDHYLRLLDNSAREAKADDMQHHMMKDVLAAGFELNEEELEYVKQQEKQQAETQKLNPEDLSLASDHSFIPLPDFDFSFESRRDRPNAAKQPKESKGFDVNLSLTSQRFQSGDQTIKQQKQDFNLTGSYYEPLAHLKKPDFEYQNYRYTEFERSASNIVRTVSEDNQLIAATIEKNQSFTSRTVEYNEGKLVNTESEEDAQHTIDDLMLEIISLSHSEPLKLLEQVLVDPYQ